MMKKIQFRKIRTQDEKRVKELLGQLTDSRKIKFNIRKIINDKATHCFVLKVGKEIVGTASLIAYHIPTKGLIGEVQDVVIDEKCRGQGLGKKIMEEVLKVAKKKKVTRLQLTSNPKRMAARKLYQKLGFEIYDTGVFRIKL